MCDQCALNTAFKVLASNQNVMCVLLALHSGKGVSPVPGPSGLTIADYPSTSRCVVTKYMHILMYNKYIPNISLHLYRLLTAFRFECEPVALVACMPTTVVYV